MVIVSGVSGARTGRLPTARRAHIRGPDPIGSTTGMGSLIDATERAVGVLVNEREQHPLPVPALDELADAERLVGQPGRLRHVIRAEQRVRSPDPHPARLACLATRTGRLGTQTVEQQSNTPR